MPTVLSTGGLGFVGSHTCISLLEKGFDVLIIDSLFNSKSSTFSKIEKIIKISKNKVEGKVFFEKGDLRNTKWLEEIFKKYKQIGKTIECVIHFAGLKSVEESVKQPLKYWEININSTLSLLSVMDLYNCHVIVFSSSATIYKPKLNLKIDESSFIEPINSYGNSKASIEKILSDLYKSRPEKWKIANLRYFNPVGAHSSSLIGEDPKGKANNIFPILINVIKKKIERLYIFGNDWPTKDGTCIRDYIHVMDLADSHAAALNFLLNNKSQVISINIGTGRGTSVLELVERFCKVNNCFIPYEFAERRPGDAPFVVADNKLAMKLLDWKPKKNLDDICKDTWNWINKK